MLKARMPSKPPRLLHMARKEQEVKIRDNRIDHVVHPKKVVINKAKMETDVTIKKEVTCNSSITTTAEIGAMTEVTTAINITGPIIVMTVIEEEGTITTPDLIVMRVLLNLIVTDKITKAAGMTTIDNKVDGMATNSQIEEMATNTTKITDNIRVVLEIAQVVIVLVKEMEALAIVAMVTMEMTDLVNSAREAVLHLMIETFEEKV